MSEQTPLTAMVACAGWASKLQAGALSQVVRQLAEFFPPAEFPNVLVGLGEPDDAAVFRLDDERALIKTTDFFTPIVDDPWTYGAIAAVNSMSDVYAMGGEVLFALNIAGFPDGLSFDVIAQIFAGAASKVREVGAAIAGGHTVNNPEPFFGLSVTGIIHPDRIMTKGGTRHGDRLFLTKPLGTGIITTAGKNAGEGESEEHRQARRAAGRVDLDPVDLDAAILSMLRSNRAASQAAVAAGVRAATDITGFGLLGHASEMVAAAHDRGFRIRAATVPMLPGLDAYVASGYLTRGTTRNPEYYGHRVRFGPDVTPLQRSVLWEVETSGGLLLSVPEAAVEQFLRECAARGQEAWAIGEVITGSVIEVV